MSETTDHGLLSSMQTAYLDTCAYSRLLDSTSPSLYPTLQRRLADLGIEIVLSPTNIIEFLQTPNELRREQLVFLSQSICVRWLAADVETILAHFIAERSGLPALRPFIMDNLRHKSRMALTWEEVHSDPRRTFHFQAADLRRFEILRQYVNLFHAHFRRGGSLSDFDGLLPEFEIMTIESVSTVIRKTAARRRESVLPDGDCIAPSIAECTALAMLLILCSEASLFPESLVALWRTLGVGTAPERFAYANVNFRFLYEGGPLLGIGAALAAQACRKYESGNAFDCLHAAYTPYFDVMYTVDNGLRQLKTDYPASVHFARIHSFEPFLDQLVGNS